MKLLEHISLVALMITVGAAHHLIDPPMWLSILGIPIGLALGYGHGKVWTHVRRARKGATR
jgi:hypothetical protein